MCLCTLQRAGIAQDAFVFSTNMTFSERKHSTDGEKIQFSLVEEITGFTGQASSVGNTGRKLKFDMLCLLIFLRRLTNLTESKVKVQTTNRDSRLKVNLPTGPNVGIGEYVSFNLIQTRQIDSSSVEGGRNIPTMHCQIRKFKTRSL